MNKARPRLAGVWMTLLPAAMLSLTFHSGGTAGAAPAGTFPAFIPMSDAVRGVEVDQVGNVYVSVGQGSGSAEHILIWKFAPDGGGPSFLADLGQGTIGGLAASADGDLYVAMAAGLDRGVWRIDRFGAVELLPNSNQIFFANGLAFDSRGTLYVTESVSLDGHAPPSGAGGVWRIPRGGQAELCLRDDLLRGTGALRQPVWLGANGIDYYHGHLYVTNTEKGTLVRIPVLPDGSLGSPELWATLQEVPESPLYGAPHPVAGDGVVLDVQGNAYVAVLTRSAVVRIDGSDLSQETIAAFQVVAHGSIPNAPLDFPASLHFGTVRGERTNLFVSSLGMGSALAPALPWAGPSLVKLDADVAGGPRRPELGNGTRNFQKDTGTPGGPFH